MLVFPSQSIVQLFNLMGCGERMWQKVGLFLIVLSTLIVVMTSYLSSLSRLREYAIMRALGATGKDISHIFLWQNAFPRPFAAPLQAPFRNRGLYLS